YVVEAGLWQAAKPLNGSVLVGCSVAPGFEFDDFSLIDSEGDVAKRILRHRVDLADLIEP
ncbi:MAG: cupin domain-containing protein, partial [Gammaproteobacteria bacterium]|nr:cupin domain-containing protein [Gammaproteobacteria bacterium]